jgi:hypothetical protein
LARGGDRAAILGARAVDRLVTIRRGVRRDTRIAISARWAGATGGPSAARAAIGRAAMKRSPARRAASLLDCHATTAAGRSTLVSVALDTGRNGGCGWRPSMRSGDAGTDPRPRGRGFDADAVAPRADAARRRHGPMRWKDACRMTRRCCARSSRRGDRPPH